MFKLKYRNILLFLILMFCMFGVISSVSACQIEKTTKIDSDNKVFNSKNKIHCISWKTDKVENNDKVNILVRYKTKNKNNKKINVHGYGLIHLEKISKNRLQISEHYSNGSVFEKISYFKTKKRAKDYYFSNFKNKITKLTKKSLLSKTYQVGSISNSKAYIFETLVWNSSTNKSNKVKINGVLKSNINTYHYTKFPQVTINVFFISLNSKLNTSSNINLTGNYLKGATFELEKVSKNKLKISQMDIRRFPAPGKSYNHPDKIIYKKTSLNPKQYYKKYFNKFLINNYLKNIII